MKAVCWRLIPLAIFSLLVFFLWRGLSLEPRKLPSAQIGKTLPAFELPTLDGDKRFTPQLMKGHIALLNIWASWCEACVDEQVFLMKLARESVAIYGLNYKDNPKNARHWLKEWGNPYQVVGQDRAGRVAIDLGVYGAPETLLVDEEGIIRYRHVGVLDEKAWQADFLPRIKQLEEKV